MTKGHDKGQDKGHKGQMSDREVMKLALEALVNNRYIIESEINLPEALEEVDVSIAVLRQALEQPDTGTDRGAWSDVPDATKWVDELRGDEEPEQEPVAWVKTLSEPQPHCVTDLKYMSFADAKASVQYIPLYAAPPKREWQGLTDEEREYLWGITPIEEEDRFAFALAVEAKLKEKNT